MDFDGRSDHPHAGGRVLVGTRIDGTSRLLSTMAGVIVSETPSLNVAGPAKDVLTLCGKVERDSTSVIDPTSSKTLHVASSHPLGAITAEEAFLLEKLHLAELPRHVAVIIDRKSVV